MRRSFFLFSSPRSGKRSYMSQNHLSFSLRLTENDEGWPLAFVSYLRSPFWRTCSVVVSRSRKKNANTRPRCVVVMPAIYLSVCLSLLAFLIQLLEGEGPGSGTDLRDVDELLQHTRRKAPPEAQLRGRWGERGVRSIQFIGEEREWGGVG